MQALIIILHLRNTLPLPRVVLGRGVDDVARQEILPEWKTAADTYRKKVRPIGQPLSLPSFRASLSGLIDLKPIGVASGGDGNGGVLPPLIPKPEAIARTGVVGSSC